MKQEETWRPVKGYEGRYEVSSEGRVKSIAHNVRLIGSQGASYPHVLLRKEGKGKHYYIHFLVAQAFHEICGELFEGCVINHRNEVKTDNRACNLEVCTQSYNVRYGDAQRKRVESREGNYKKGKPVLQFSKDGKFIKRWEGGAREAQRELGIRTAHIYSVANCRKSYDTAGGFVWLYD